MNKIKTPEEVYLEHFAKDNVFSKDTLLSIFKQSDIKPVMESYAEQFKPTSETINIDGWKLKEIYYALRVVSLYREKGGQPETAMDRRVKTAIKLLPEESKN